MSKQLGDILENLNFIWLRGHTTLEVLETMILWTFLNKYALDLSIIQAPNLISLLNF